MIIFENAGEIDPRLIATFGVNVKEGDNPIGFFGTGLKYALAILLRTGHEVVIQSGGKALTFAKLPIEMRGKTFDVVAMNGEPLGFTTEVGKSWEVWMAYRELYCNALDEGGAVREATEAPEPTPGVTRAIVTGDGLETAHRERDRYFLASKPAWTCDDGEIHIGPSDGVFYRGVRVMTPPKRTAHTYNIRAAIALTEDRTSRSSWEVGYHMARTILHCENEAVVKDCVTAAEHFFEHDLSYTDHATASETFLATVGRLMRDRVGTISPSAVRLYTKLRHVEFNPDTVPLTGIEKQMLDKALRFCAGIGFNIQYPIIVAESLGEGFLALARDEKIYLSQRVFMQGTKAVASTLIEEYLHLKHRLADCSRELQTYLFDRIVSLGEELQGEPL